MLTLLKRLFSGRRETGDSQRQPPAQASRSAATRQRLPTSKPPATELLDNPDLSLHAPQDPGFDPYNTGTFNRGGSWERINKRRNN